MTKNKKILFGLHELAMGIRLPELALNLYAGNFSLQTVKYFTKTA